jgi:hypothetical protein
LVLMVLWNGSTVLNRPEAVGLKAVQSAFGHDNRFFMLGVICDTRDDEARTRIAELGWSWLQVKPDTQSGWDLRQKYNAYELPAIWLFGRDGKVIAGNLRGAAIKETVERAINSK